jgi:Multiubiquitin
MTDDAGASAVQAERHHETSFQIQIDRVHYTVHQETMTGEQLRHVPPVPIPADRDLYEVRPGEQDRLIGDADTVEIRDGLRFFTAPHHINPGNKA